MPTKTKKTAFTKSNSKLLLKFWIPYIILTAFLATILCLNQFTVLTWVSFFTILLITFFIKNKILSKKLLLRISFWLVFFVVTIIAIKLTIPAPKDRMVISSGNNIYTNSVQTKYGAISGVYNSDKSVKIYAGIPYAAPPVGNLRWKAPQEPKKWNGVLKADHFSDCPAQNKLPTSVSKLLDINMETDSINYATTVGNEKSSEDCLYLNIWTSSKNTSKKRPVIVYIYGGSFTGGSGSSNIYNGEHIAKKGAVYVTINYRVGVFGFMSSPELNKESGYGASGNYGILDQIAALKWLKSNVAAFGGDSLNITIAGESAGSMSVNMLQASPLTKGLFQRVIAESAANFGSRGIKGGPMETIEAAEQNELKLEKVLNKSSLADLRKVSTAELLKASKNISMRPIVDGYVLPDTIYSIYESGKQNDVPTLIGYNSNESSLYLKLPFPISLSTKFSPLSAEKFQSTITETYGTYASQFLKIYPANNNDQALKSELSSGTLQWFGWHMHTWAKLQSQTGKSKVFLYYFNHVQPGPSKIKELGAYHTSEIAYAYGNLRKIDLPYTSYDYKLSNIMSTYWYNFASTGDPNGTGLPQWDEFDTKTDQTMELGDLIKMIPSPNKDKLNFFDKYEAALREN